ncbi:MAG: acetyl-CoA hydrolase/transferase C-terminal domain-containing protein [Desulfobacter sp.]
MAATQAEFINHVEVCVDRILDTVGRKIVFGIPLALGKPNHLANALYLRAKNNPAIDLTIITALSLEKPSASSTLEARLLDPIVKRIWDGFVEFEYMKDLRKNQLPPNVRISEFFTKAGGYLNSPYAQQNYISTNYTHAVRDLIDNGLNVIGNMIAPHPDGNRNLVSMSCNPDLTVEGFAKMIEVRKQGRKTMIIGQMNANLPYMYGDAVMESSVYDIILDDPKYDFPLFSVPKASVAPADHMIGLNVSTLIRDNGTLQIGIGSLGDAIASSMIMRHHQNDAYCAALNTFNIPGRYSDLVRRIGGTGSFEKGVYGATEMLVDVFVQLYKNGILKRKVYDNAGIQELVNAGALDNAVPPDILDILVRRKVISERLTKADFRLLMKYGIIDGPFEYMDGRIIHNGTGLAADLRNKTTREILESHLGKHLKEGVVCHGAFFIGPKGFYKALNNMSEQERKLFSMTGVDYVNQLYGDEHLKSLQRQHGRFVNAGMMVTLLGAVVSDGLESGNIVSGVGGQYNFVSMAHALDDGRLIMMIRSTKKSKGKLSSNIVFNYGHTTIPRHLRDIVVTEYGIADLRGKCDQEVIAEMLNVADSRFQDELLDQAKKAGKIAPDYEIPAAYRNNTPEYLNSRMAPLREQGFFKDFPFGTDYTREEVTLARALKGLKEKVATRKYRTVAGIVRHFFTRPPAALQPLLHRMKLDLPGCLKERALRAAVVYALRENG